MATDIIPSGPEGSGSLGGWKIPTYCGFFPSVLSSTKRSNNKSKSNLKCRTRLCNIVGIAERDINDLKRRGISEWLHLPVFQTRTSKQEHQHHENRRQNTPHWDHIVASHHLRTKLRGWLPDEAWDTKTCDWGLTSLETRKGFQT